MRVSVSAGLAVVLVYVVASLIMMVSVIKAKSSLEPKKGLFVGSHSVTCSITWRLKAISVPTNKSAILRDQHASD